jgi:nucleoside-diphosphate-sugar epimerase
MTWIERIAGQRILVTGARGFLGSNVCRRLHEAGIEMHAAGRTLPSKTLKLCTWHKADLADANAAQALLRNVRPDIIVHLAGYVNGARELQHVLPSFHGDLATTVNVLTAAAELGHARVVFPSSMEEPAPDRPHDVPSSPYAAAKWAAGAYARMFHALYQTPVIMLRLFMTYGPGQRDRKIIPYTILSLLKGESPQLASGRRPVDWIYVDDVVDGLLTASVASDVEGRTLDLGSGVLVPIRDVIEQIVQLTGGGVQASFGAQPDPPMQQVRAADLAKTSAMLDWRPAITLQEGLRRTIAWYAARLL